MSFIDSYSTWMPRVAVLGITACTLATGTAWAQSTQDDDDTTMAERVGEDFDLIRQQTMREFEMATSRAYRAAFENRFDQAEREVNNAGSLLQSRRDYLSESEIEKMSAQLAEMRELIDTKEYEHKIAQDKIRQDDIEKAQQEAANAARLERERQIEELLIRVRELQAELNYAAALQVVDQILFIDPHHNGALALRAVMKTGMVYEEFGRSEQIMDESFNVLEKNTRDAVIPPRPNRSGPGPRGLNDIVNYPEDWAALSIRRTGGTSYIDSVGNRRVARNMNTPIPVNFAGVSLHAAFDYLADTSDVQIYPDWRALELIGINRNAKITLQLRDVSMRTALDQVLRQVGDQYDRPQWDIQDGLLLISSGEELSRNTVTLVHDIRDLLFEVKYFDDAPEMRMDQYFGSKSNSRGASAFDESIDVFAEPDFDAASHTRAQLVEDLISVIQNTVDPQGWRDLGGDVGSIQELNGNLIVTNTPRNHQLIEGLLSQLREIRALQINVEARFLSVATNWFEQIGIDLDLYFDTNGSVRDRQLQADPLSHLSDLFGGNGRLQDPFFFGEIDPDGDGVPTVNPPFGSLFGVTDPTTTLTGLPVDATTYTSGTVGAPIRTTSKFAPVGFVQDHFNLVNTLAGFDLLSFAGTAAASNPALSVGIQFLDDVQVDLLIEATQADKRSVVLTAPRVTLMNGSASWVAIQRQEVFVTGLTAVTGDGSGAFQPDFNTIADGVSLGVTGVVSADRRYVFLTIETTLSEIVDRKSISSFGGAAGGTSVGGGGGASFDSGVIETPIQESSQVATNVSVPDKGTVLLGGQRIVEETEVETGVPMLSKIPFINRFFTNRTTAKDESTLMILVRPEIIIQQENEDILFPGLGSSLGSAGSYLQ